MEDIINTMLTLAEQAKSHKHISFVPKVVKDDSLKGVTIVKLPGASDGLLVGTQDRLSFIFVHWLNFGKARQHHKVMYKDIARAVVSDGKITVRKKKGLFKEHSYELLAENPERFIEALSEYIDIDVLEVKAEAPKHISRSRTVGQSKGNEQDEKAKREEEVILLAGAYHYLQEKEEAEAAANEELELDADLTHTESQPAVPVENLSSSDLLDQLMREEEIRRSKESDDSSDSDGYDALDG